MKSNKIISKKLSKRRFFGTTAALVAGTLLPPILSYGSNSKPVGKTAEPNERNARSLGPIAKNNGMFAILYNHAQFTEPGFDVDRLLSYSSANMLNFDVGYYFGSTGLNPTNFIRNYHDRIASIHLKDKTIPYNITGKNTNKVWRQGETPLAEVLHLIRDQKLPIYCDIELEYPVNPWSTSIKEVKICKEYCRQILI